MFPFGQVLDMINNPHYLYRMTILRAISLLVPVMGSEITCSKLLPVVVTVSKDRVPNIKFNAAKVLQSLILIVDQFASQIHLDLADTTQWWPFLHSSHELARLLCPL